MKRTILFAAVLATATAAAAFATTGSSPSATSPTAHAYPDADQLPVAPRQENYTRVADTSGSCWVKSMGQTHCSLGYESTCETANNVFITRVFIAGGNCNDDEKPF